MPGPGVQEGARRMPRDKAIRYFGSADGQGARSENLSGKPMNFHNKEWRADTTPLHLFEVLTEGKRGTSMPAWPTMSSEQKWDVVAYVLSVAEDGP